MLNILPEPDYSAASRMGTTKKVKKSAVRKRAQSVKLNAKASLGAKVTYKKVSSNNKALSLKNGKVTLKRGNYKKGSTFTMKVKAIAAGTKNYSGDKEAAKVTFKIT